MKIQTPDAATVDYYERNHKAYDAFSSLIDMSSQRNRFLSYIPGDGIILDLGCGSGRDLVYFLKSGFRAEGMDPSPTMAQLASQRSGVRVFTQAAEQINIVEAYNGIWASASLLHIPKSRFRSVFAKVMAALREGGCLYMSLKEGVGEVRDEGGRYYSLYQIAELEAVISQTSQAKLSEFWFSADDAGRSGTRWLNLLVCKQHNDLA